MVPIDFRNAKFSEIQSRLFGDRLSVYEALQHHGPCTTRELAKHCDIDLLTIRPRMTELYQLGLVVCINDGEHAREGIYRALTAAEAETAFQAKQASLQDPQRQFML